MSERYTDHFDTKYPLENFGFRQFFGYNRKGELELRLGNHTFGIPELARTFGSPLEVVIPERASLAAIEYKSHVDSAAAVTGYQGDLEVAYASKAAVAAEIVVAALNTGNKGISILETSSEGDLQNIRWLISEGLVDPQTPIICNGHKAPPTRFLNMGKLSRRDQLRTAGDLSNKDNPPSYVEAIVDMHLKGYNIMPIIDSMAELEYVLKEADKFAEPMKVGVRFASYGLIKQGMDLSTLHTRHGMYMGELADAAGKIHEHPKLQLDTFHAMVGAADSFPPEKMVEALGMCFEEFCQLRKRFPELSTFNIGGGVPAFGWNYDHDALFEGMLAKFKEISEKYGQDHPTIHFEPGSPIAAAAGFTTVSATEMKQSPERPFVNIDTSFMSITPDTFILGLKFPFLAANYANRRVMEASLGGTTCDSADVIDKLIVPRYKMSDFASNRTTPLLAILTTQAYQEMLRGGGSAHCMTTEPAEVIMYGLTNGLFRMYRGILRPSDPIRKRHNYSHHMHHVLSEVARLARYQASLA